MGPEAGRLLRVAAAVIARQHRIRIGRETRALNWRGGRDKFRNCVNLGLQPAKGDEGRE